MKDIFVSALNKEEIKNAYKELPPGDQYEIDLLVKKIFNKKITIRRIGILGAMELLAKLGIWLVQNTPKPPEDEITKEQAAFLASAAEIYRLSTPMPTYPPKGLVSKTDIEEGQHEADL